MVADPMKAARAALHVTRKMGINDSNVDPSAVDRALAMTRRGGFAGGGAPNFGSASRLFQDIPDVYPVALSQDVLNGILSPRVAYMGKADVPLDTTYVGSNRVPVFGGYHLDKPDAGKSSSSDANDPYNKGSAGGMEGGGGKAGDPGGEKAQALAEIDAVNAGGGQGAGSGPGLAARGGRIHRADGGETDFGEPNKSKLSGAPVNYKTMFQASPATQQVGRLNDFNEHVGPVSIGSLSSAFDKAISHHLSLPPEERILNRKKADEALAPYVGRRKDRNLVPLLGVNGKLMKTGSGYRGGDPVTLPDGRGIETAGLALSPSYQEGKFNTCPNSASCKDECLGKTSGNYFKVGGGKNLSEFKGPRLNSLNKTIAMMRNPEAFAVRLHDEIAAAKRVAESNGNLLGIRLNVLSDVNPRVHKSIIEAHPDVAFYDYTKNNSNPIAPNHHYTYSSTGLSQPRGLNNNEHDVVNNHQNWKQMRRRLDGGDNVAMAFSDKEHIPEFVHDEETGKKYKVINGDTHDFRPLDMQPEGAEGVIVGLKNKKVTSSKRGAAKESNGFFVHYDPAPKKTEKGTYERGESVGINPETGKPFRAPTIPTNRIVRIAPQPENRRVSITKSGQEE